MQAYSTFANNGVKKNLYAIERIEDAQGGVIEEHRDTPGEEVFSPAAAYIVNRILSNNDYRPQSPFWREQLSIKGKTVAAKTGTANKPATRGRSTILPGDVWTIGYSPTITTVVWAGNVDGSPMKGGCINCAAPAWNKFMTKALEDTGNVEFPKPEGLYTFDTVKSSGLLPREGADKSGLVSNIMAVKLTEVDAGSKEVKYDTLCGGPVTANTPEDSVGVGYVPSSSPIIDRFDPEWLKGFFAAANIAASSLAGNRSDTPCERPTCPGNVSIATKIVGVGNNILEVSWNGNRMIQKFRVTVDGKVLKENDHGSGASTQGSDRISTNQFSGDTVVTVDLVDSYGYRYSRSGQPGGSLNSGLPSESGSQDLPSLIDEIGQNNPNAPGPSIVVSNPTRSSINIYQGDMFNLRFQVDVKTTRRNVVVTIDGNVVQSATSGEVFIIPVSSSDISVGSHQVAITATDANEKTATKNFTLNILAR